MYRVLLVTDCEGDGVASILRSSGYTVIEATALAADASQVDLILLSSDANGSVCADRIREVRKNSNLPLIVLAADEGVTECVVALEMGADDYIRKPVEHLELIARVKSLLRRVTSYTAKPKDVLVADDIELHANARLVKQSGDPIRLTAVEYELLKILLLSAGSLVTREVISREVFRRRPHLCNRSIDVHMSTLRQKLGPRRESNDARIQTIRGFGFIYLATIDVDD